MEREEGDRKKALFVIMDLKRLKVGDEKLRKFIKTHVSRMASYKDYFSIILPSQVLGFVWFVLGDFRFREHTYMIPNSDISDYGS